MEKNKVSIEAVFYFFLSVHNDEINDGCNDIQMLQITKERSV